jgi:hypothetical protein
MLLSADCKEDAIRWISILNVSLHRLHLSKFSNEWKETWFFVVDIVLSKSKTLTIIDVSVFLKIVLETKLFLSHIRYRILYIRNKRLVFYLLGEFLKLFDKRIEISIELWIFAWVCRSRIHWWLLCFVCLQVGRLLLLMLISADSDLMV